MRLDRDPDRSRSLSPPPSDDENNNNNNIDDEEEELLATIAEKEAEMRRTEELLNERIKQVEITLAQLHQMNNLLEEVEILQINHVNTKK